MDYKLWYILHGQNTRRFWGWMWMNILYLNGYTFIFLHIREQNSETIKLMFLELLLSRNRPCKEVSWFKVDVKTCIKHSEWVMWLWHKEWMKVYANDSGLGSRELGIERGLTLKNIVITEYTIITMEYTLWKCNFPHKSAVGSLSIFEFQRVNSAKSFDKSVFCLCP